MSFDQNHGGSEGHPYLPAGEADVPAVIPVIDEWKINRKWLPFNTAPTTGEWFDVCVMGMSGAELFVPAISYQTVRGGKRILTGTQNILSPCLTPMFWSSRVAGQIVDVKHVGKTEA